MNLTKEIWKPIAGYEGFYSISTLGDVYSHIRDRKLKPYPTPKGYLFIDLKGKSFSVHRLVMKTFEPSDLQDLYQVNHLDGNKANNDINNLQWCTNLENQQHSWRNGRKAPRGSHNGVSKLKESQVKEIIKLINRGDRLVDISNKYRVHKSTISKIKTRKNWSYLWN